MQYVKKEKIGSYIYYENDEGEEVLKEIIPHLMSESFWKLWHRLLLAIEDRHYRVVMEYFTYVLKPINNVCGELSFKVTENGNDKYIITKEDNVFRIFLGSD